MSLGRRRSASSRPLRRRGDAPRACLSVAHRSPPGRCRRATTCRSRPVRIVVVDTNVVSPTTAGSPSRTRSRSCGARPRVRRGAVLLPRQAPPRRCTVRRGRARRSGADGAARRGGGGRRRRSSRGTSTPSSTSPSAARRVRAGSTRWPGRAHALEGPAAAQARSYAAPGFAILEADRAGGSPFQGARRRRRSTAARRARRGPCLPVECR